MAFRNFADGSCLDEFDHAAIIILCVNLRSHLSRDSGGRSGFSNDSSLINIVSQRLFAIHMLAQLQRGQCGEGMSMFAGADDNGIELIGVIKNLAKVGIFPSPGMRLGRTIKVIRIHVAERGNMFGRDRLEIPATSTTATDHGNSQLVES